MATVGIFEAKNRLSELVERAARGEEIVITRRARGLAARIRLSRAGQPLGTGDSIRNMIEEGRR